MNTSLITAMFALVAHEYFSSEVLVILSNLAVVGATLVLVAVTVREAHKTIRQSNDTVKAVVRSDNRLLARVLGPVLVKPEPGHHKRADK